MKSAANLYKRYTCHTNLIYTQKDQLETLVWVGTVNDFWADGWSSSWTGKGVGQRFKPAKSHEIRQNTQKGKLEIT